MERHEFLNDYFIKIYRKFGISKINFDGNVVEMDEKYLRNMVFGSENFNNEYEKLLYHCKAVYSKLKRGFLIKIKKDMSNNYFVTFL